jgi:hypothetical protein
MSGGGDKRWIDWLRNKMRRVEHVVPINSRICWEQYGFRRLLLFCASIIFGDVDFLAVSIKVLA